MRRVAPRPSYEPAVILRFNGLRSVAGVLVLFGVLAVLASIAIIVNGLKVGGEVYGRELGITTFFSGFMMLGIGFTMSAVAMIAETVQESRESHLRSERLLARLVELEYKRDQQAEEKNA